MNYNWNGKRIANPSPIQKLGIWVFCLTYFVLSAPAMLVSWFLGVGSPYNARERSLQPTHWHLLGGIAFWVVFYLIVAAI